jgi:hypothetical protein
MPHEMANVYVGAGKMQVEALPVEGCYVEIGTRPTIASPTTIRCRPSS